MDKLVRNSDGAETRVDLLLIASMVKPGTRVLDVGSGDGALLSLLEGRKKRWTGRGIELSQEGVNQCVAKGLSVIQGDADADLVDYPDKGFDYAILSQTLQATRKPREVLEQLLRIADRVIVSLPNFAHWSFRSQLLLTGRMPVTKNAPDQLVRHAQYPFLHNQGFSGPVRSKWGRLSNNPIR